MRKKEPVVEYCRKVERVARWTNNERYTCDMKKGHAGRCACWSRSSSGRAYLIEPVPREEAIYEEEDC